MLCRFYCTFATDIDFIAMRIKMSKTKKIAILLLVFIYFFGAIATIENFKSSSSRKEVPHYPCIFSEELLAAKSKKLNTMRRQYEKEQGRSLVFDLKRSILLGTDSLAKQKNRLLLNELRIISRPNSWTDSQFLAYDLIEQLNGDDKQSIKELMGRINIHNYKTVYSQYIKMTRLLDERASTKEERQRSWHSTRNKKVRGARPESLLQGILNNESLTLDEKEEYMLFFVDKYIEDAQNKNVNPQYIEAFKKLIYSEVKQNIRYTNSKGKTFIVSNPNAVSIEDKIYYFSKEPSRYFKGQSYN